MKKVLKRVISVFPALLFQVLWYMILLRWLSQWATQITLVLTLLSVIFILYIVTKEDDGTYKILWILVIMGAPVLGAILYLSFGNKGPTGILKKKLDQVGSGVRALSGDSALDDIPEVRMRQTYSYLEDVTGYPVKRSEDVTYYPVGEELYADLLFELKQAKHFIFMEYFIVEHGVFLDSIIEILEQKAKEGVDVRFLYDDLGSISTYSVAEADQLRLKGIHVCSFNRLLSIRGTLNYRDHRKMTVIDGKVAFTGGINLADEYINRFEKYGHWKDTGLRLKGEPAANYTRMFAEFWDAFSDDPIPLYLLDGSGEALLEGRSYSDKIKKQAAVLEEDDINSGLSKSVLQENSKDTESVPEAASGWVLSYYDSPIRRENASNDLYVSLLYQAQHTAYFFTPYLMLGDSLLEAFTKAARRGVDVRIIMPGIPDKKLVYRMSHAFYIPLLESGVKIYEYTPGFVHAKACVVDGMAGCIGTVNLDYRSLFLHFENNSFFYQDPVLHEVEKDFLETQEKCEEIVLGRNLKLTLRRWLWDGILRILSPLC
ncbi:MAG: phospholipase D-like domain-containing protein [Lachnospiraceae bacterium]|nr:phospholipase D-like domain-containing protein [Lachnospiraceae bacterium]